MAWIIFVIALCGNVIWFFIVTYSYVLFFFACNLCFMFIYALFFVQMPYYAVKYQDKFEQTAIGGYHLHENFYGVLLILLGMVMFFIYWWLPIGHEALRFIIYHVARYFGVFCIMLGGFLIGRDYRYTLKFKFIEKTEGRVLDPNFNRREKFYHISQVGIVSCLIGISILLENSFLATAFSLDQYWFITLGMGLIIVGAILSGLNPTYFAQRVN